MTTRTASLVMLTSMLLGCGGSSPRRDALSPSAPLFATSTATATTTAAASELEVREGVVPCTEAIRFAWANAPRLRAATALVAASVARRDALRAGYLPQLNAAGLATAGFPGSGSNLGVRGMMGSPVVNHWAAGLEGSWSALEFLRIEPSVGVTFAEEAAAKAEQARIERDVALMIVDVYERTLTAEAQLEVTDADITSRRAHVAALDALGTAGGTIPATDVLQAKAALARTEAERAAALADRDGLRSVLVTLVGDQRMASAKLVLDAPTSDARIDPDRAAARAHREAAERLRDIAWRDLLPRVIVGGSAGYAHAPPPQDPGLWAAGVAIVVPLTGTFSERPRQEVAALTAESRAYEADAKAQEIEVRRGTLRATLKALELALPSAEASTVAAREAMSAVEARARGGLIREVDVETARLAVVQAAVAEAEIRFRLQATRSRLAWMGG